MGRLTLDLATCVTSVGIGFAALALSWGAVRIAKSLIAYRRWRRLIESEERLP